MLSINGRYTIKVWKKGRNVETFTVQIIGIEEDDWCRGLLYMMKFDGWSDTYIYTVNEVSQYISDKRWTIQRIDILLDDSLFRVE